MAELRFFNPYADIRFTANRLPHWQQQGAVYFITYRLADAVPHHLRTQWESEREAWLRVHRSRGVAKSRANITNASPAQSKPWLDASHGTCILRRHDCAEIVAETLRYFDGQRALMISFVVMPNHVRAVFVQHPSWPLQKLLRSWKSFTSHKINSLLSREGTLWQRDYFDRLVRDQKHFANCVRYIRRNPKRAGMRNGEYILYESELARSIE